MKPQRQTLLQGVCPMASAAAGEQRRWPALNSPPAQPSLVQRVAVVLPNWLCSVLLCVLPKFKISEREAAPTQRAGSLHLSPLMYQTALLQDISHLTFPLAAWLPSSLSCSAAQA